MLQITDLWRRSSAAAKAALRAGIMVQLGLPVGRALAQRPHTQPEWPNPAYFSRRSVAIRPILINVQDVLKSAHKTS